MEATVLHQLSSKLDVLCHPRYYIGLIAFRNWMSKIGSYYHIFCFVSFKIGSYIYCIMLNLDVLYHPNMEAT